MEDITRLDIDRDGLDRPQGGIGGRKEAAQRANEYGQWLRRMELDQVYRAQWEANERGAEKANQKHNI